MSMKTTRQTAAEIFDPRRLRNFLSLIDSVTRSVVQRQRTGRGKLLPTIPDIQSDQPFTDWPVVYLPPRGQAIFIGDTHGDSLAVSSVLRGEGFIERVSSGEPVYLVVMGDVADRGKADVKNLELLLGLKKSYPANVFLLRGNHEELSLGQRFGLLQSCLKTFGFEQGQQVFEELNAMYERWPAMAVTGNGIVAVHGGIPVEDIHSLLDLRDENITEEMRWNDPSADVHQFVFNYMRGGYYLFGREVFARFMDAIGATVLVRSHEYVSSGCKFMFDNRLVTIFSNGGTSEESGYQDFILAPKYVKADLSRPIEAWSDQNVLDIPYADKTGG
ncbi:MAG: metallophosphoesterase family protein [Patescibacteria group bacterium]